MDEIIKLNNIDDYSRMFGLETLHPLVNVVDLKGATRFPTHFKVNYGIYSVFLKDTKCGDIRYGRQTYDYQEGTVVSFAPGQITEVDMNENTKPSALGILFHPDFIKGTSLGHEIKQYSFFSYESAEALHLSEDERKIFVDCMNNIRTELNRPIDKHSHKLIIRNIELLLDYCTRLYERPFETRTKVNRDVLTRFETLLDEYFTNGMPQEEGLPTVRYFADKICLSPNYFGDLIKKETGKTAQEYIQNKVIDISKEMILGTAKTVSEIAYDLGFQYSQHFNRIFKKNVGITPTEYRKQSANTCPQTTHKAQ